MRAGVAQSGDTRHFTDEQWQHLAPRLSYLAGDPTDPATQRAIGARLEQMHTAGTPANRLFYLSTPPSLAPRVVTAMGAQRHRRKTRAGHASSSKSPSA